MHSLAFQQATCTSARPASLCNVAYNNTSRAHLLKCASFSTASQPQLSQCPSLKQLLTCGLQTIMKRTASASSATAVQTSAAIQHRVTLPAVLAFAAVGVHILQHDKPSSCMFLTCTIILDRQLPCINSVTIGVSMLSSHCCHTPAAQHAPNFSPSPHAVSHCNPYNGCRASALCGRHSATCQTLVGLINVNKLNAKIM